MSIEKRTTTRVLLAAMLLIGLAACESEQPLGRRVKHVTDLGTVPLPNSSYVLHGYQVVNDGERDHYVYFAEQDNQIVSGAQSNHAYSCGKSCTAVQSVTSVMPPQESSAPTTNGTSTKLELTLSCASEKECQELKKSLLALTQRK